MKVSVPGMVDSLSLEKDDVIESESSQSGDGDDSPNYISPIISLKKADNMIDESGQINSLH